MNANGGIEHMHNNYPTWTSMFPHVHEIKNYSRLSFRRVIPAFSWMVVGSPAMLVPKLFYLNKISLRKKSSSNLDPHTTSE